MPIKLIFLFSLFCFWANAQELELSTDSHWLKLLHYSKNSSDIKKGEFFISSEGEYNPLAELKATIQGMRESQDIYCRYPARRLWLEKKGIHFPKFECPDFEAYTRNNEVKSISLIFASGFLGNPASYFGHPLIKFNFKDERSPLDLLDLAINYGAFTPNDIDPVSYMAKGAFGGFDAGFTTVDFFFHKNNYSELELRDLWEYELKLKQEERDEIVAHIWEMKKAKITYYFASDNCAYRVGELLEMVTGKSFNQRGLPFAIPVSLFHKIHDYHLVENIKLHPSRQTRLRGKVRTLNKREYRVLKEITDDIDRIDNSDFNSLSVEEKSRTLETAMDYFSYRQVENEDPRLKTSKRKVLQERVKLPPSKNQWWEIPQRPPHEAQKPIMTQFSGFHSEKFGNGGHFRFRPAFYDLVSPDSARPLYSSLSVLDTEISVTKDRLWLKNLNLLSIESLNLSKTGLKGDGGYAWRVLFGADQMNLACNTCTVPKVEFGVGKAFEISDWLLIYAMIDPRFQTQFEGSGYLSVRPNLATLITITDDLRIHAVAGRRFYLDRNKKAENIYHIEARLGSHRSWDIRINYQEHIDRRYGLGIGLYW